jgi:hypothetical protein
MRIERGKAIERATCAMNFGRTEKIIWKAGNQETERARDAAKEQRRNGKNKKPGYIVSAFPSPFPAFPLSTFLAAFF